MEKNGENPLIFIESKGDLFQDLSVFPIFGEIVGFIVWFTTSSLFLKIACKDW